MGDKFLVVAILVGMAGLGLGLWLVLRPSETVREGTALAVLEEASEEVIEQVVDDPGILTRERPELAIGGLVEEATEDEADIASEELASALTDQIEKVSEVLEGEVEELVESSPEGAAPGFEEISGELVEAALGELAEAEAIPKEEGALEDLAVASAESAIEAVGAERIFAEPTTRTVDEFERDFSRSLFVELDGFVSNAAREAAEEAKQNLSEPELSDLAGVADGPIAGTGEAVGSVGMGAVGGFLLNTLLDLLRKLPRGASTAQVTVGGTINVSVTRQPTQGQRKPS